LNINRHVRQEMKTPIRLRDDWEAMNRATGQRFKPN
jgi:hypothetical protein